MKKRKGVILAGGKGSRLYPLTLAISKQLMPVHDKPMIYYPLTTLMLAGIREFLIISNQSQLGSFKNLLGDGSSLGINIDYASQPRPEGIAQALIIAEEFLSGSNVALILGDNLFHGNQLISKLENALQNDYEASIFAYPVSNPSRYGVVEISEEGLPISIQEKPPLPKSRYAITGLYFYENSVVDKAKSLKPSDRGELEITSINQIYLKEKKLNVQILGRGVAWLDTGTLDALAEASAYVRTLEKRQGLKIGSPEEVAWRNGWINNVELEKLGNSLIASDYGKYLLDLKNNYYFR